MRISVDFVVRHLESRSYKVERHAFSSSHLMAMDSCRAYERGMRLEPNALYVASPNDLPKRLSIPENTAFLIAGEPGLGTRIKGMFMTVDDASFIKVLNEAFEVFHAYSQLERSLMQVLDERGSVQELVSVVAPFFDNEIIVMNSNFRVAAHSYETIELYRISGITPPEDHETVPIEVASFFQNDAIYRDVEKSRTPFYYDPSVFSVRVYCINIIVQNEYASRLVLCETRKSIEPCDEELFMWFSAFVQKQYDRTDSAVDLGDDSLASLIEDLLEGVPRTRDRIERALAHRGWQSGDAIVCACLKTSGYESRSRTLPYYSREIARAFPETCSVVHAGYIALIANLSSCNGDPEKFFNRFALMQREGNLRIGQSPVFYNLDETRGRFAQARVALEIALVEHPHQWRNTFSGVRLSYVRECALHEIDSTLLVAEEIERLARFDQEHGTSYTETLRCYLEHKMNALQASAALFVHRATMVYRLKRIQEIAGIDFDDGDQVLYLQLSFKLFD